MFSVSAIYIILNKKNGKLYLGQAQNIHKRWQHHRRLLIRGKHDNPHLQNAWNKHGSKSFEFKILERCSPDQLNEREQHYLNLYLPKGVCYNIAPEVGTTRGIPRTEEFRKKMSYHAKNRSVTHRNNLADGISKRYIVYSPDGVEYQVKGLAQFCRENDLHQGHMSSVANGKLQHYKGWKCRKIT